MSFAYKQERPDDPAYHRPVDREATQTLGVTLATAGGACVGEAHVITVSGDANRGAAAELDRALRAVYEEGGENVAVDLSHLDAIEGSLDVLLRHVARFRARGGDVVLACGVEAQIDGDLRVEGRIDDAVASLLR